MNRTVFWLLSTHRRCFEAGSMLEFSERAKELRPREMLDYLVSTEVDGEPESEPQKMPFLPDAAALSVGTLFSMTGRGVVVTVVTGELSYLDEVLARLDDVTLLVPLERSNEIDLALLSLAERHNTFALLEPT